MAHAVEHEQLGAGYLVGQSVSVRRREHWILRALHDEGRRRKVGKAMPPRCAGVDRERVSRTCLQIRGAIDHAFCPRPRGRGVEVRGIWAIQLDEELDSGLRSIAAPVRARSGEVVAAVNVSIPWSPAAMRELAAQLGPALQATARQIAARVI